MNDQAPSRPDRVPSRPRSSQPRPSRPRLRIVHLFPALLGVYGDGGNVRTLVARAERRGIGVSVTAVEIDDRRIPPADLFVVGGGQDREQIAVARALERLGGEICGQVADGAAILAVCAGFQSLGCRYETVDGTTVDGPGLFELSTANGEGRLTGPVLLQLTAEVLATVSPTVRTVVGFENHGGRTSLAPGSPPLATIEIGAGNNGEDGTEGAAKLPGSGGIGGLRVGTYLHGPLLPRNPHLADWLLASALARGGELPVLQPLDDRLEWEAHTRFVERVRARERRERRMPGWMHRLVDAPRSLIGF